MAPSFIESGFTTKVEYDASLAGATGGATAAAAPATAGEPMTLGYWKIRGLAAPLRMMFHHTKTDFKMVSYGEDGGEQWFGGDKPKLAAKNSMINLPYLIDGDTVVTQSNSCLLYLGQKLGIDKPEFFARNHQVLDQVMDLRNDTMKIAYGPAGNPFKPALEKHMDGAANHLKKLEGFCAGPYMCGATMQSGDYHVFEMLDQHVMMCADEGVAFDLAGSYPKLTALHAKVKGEGMLQGYFKGESYAKFAVNNPNYANYNGKGYKAPFGSTVRADVILAKAKKEGGKGPAEQAKLTPEEKKAKEAAKDAEKRKLKIIKEGGKKGVEIEGASDMGGLDFFCTTMELPEGDIDELELSMLAMNAEPDPEGEDRKGCSGHIGKMIYSAGVEQLAIVAYVPDNEFNKSAEKVDVTEWMKDVCAKVGADITKAAVATKSKIPNTKTGDLLTGTEGKTTGKVVCAIAKSNPEAGKFALKDKDAAMAAAFAFLRAKGAFPEDNDDDSDDMIFGDDDDLDAFD